MLSLSSRTVFASALAVLAACAGSNQKQETTVSNVAGPEAAAAAAEAPVEGIPEGFLSVTPGLVVADVDVAVAFYGKAFGATSQLKVPGPDGKTMHAEIRLGDSVVMLSAYHGGELKPPQKLGGTVGSLNLYVEDVDGLARRATAAGAKVLMPLADQFWGDRWGMLEDPFGHRWGIGTAKVSLTDEQIENAAALAFAPGGAEKVKAMWASAPAAESYKQDGYHDVTPALHLADAAAVVDFYKSAVGATERRRIAMPDGKLMHGEIEIGDSVVMLSEEMPEMGNRSPQSLDGSSMYLYVYVPNVDELAARASAAGATIDEPREMFWGDRIANLTDPSGHRWSLATHTRDVSADEMIEAIQSIGGEENVGPEAPAALDPAADDADDAELEEGADDR